MCMTSRGRMYEAGRMLWALQILESNSKLHCRNLISRDARERTCARRVERLNKGTRLIRQLLTRSRKSINICASFISRFLVAAILDGELRIDLTSERHSFEVI